MNEIIILSVLFVIVLFIVNSMICSKTIKCVTTKQGQKLYYIPSDEDYNSIQPELYCVTETEAMTKGYCKHKKIKCNISKNGDKIYHLPEDRLYDITKIDPSKGEMYCVSEQEAILKGFVRSKVR